MGYSTFGKRVSRLFRKRGVRERLAQVSDPRDPRGRRWSLSQVLETVLGGLVLQRRSCHRLDEMTRTGPPLRVGELALAPIPDATLQWVLPQVDCTEVRHLVVASVRAEVRRKSVGTPAGALRPLAIDGKCLWSGRRGGCEHGQVKGEMRVHRVMRALLTSARPQVCLDQRTLGAVEHEMGALATFWAQLLQTYGRLDLWEVVTGDAGYCSRKTATLIDAAGSGYVLGLKENQPELLREVQRLLRPLAATQPPEAKILERDHGQWVRRRLWRSRECAGWSDWAHLRQVWLVRTEKFVRQTTPRADSMPVEVEEHYYLTNLLGTSWAWSGAIGASRTTASHVRYGLAGRAGLVHERGRHGCVGVAAAVGLQLGGAAQGPLSPLATAASPHAGRLCRVAGAGESLGRSEAVQPPGGASTLTPTGLRAGVQGIRHPHRPL